MDIYCSYCGETAVLIRTKNKKLGTREYLCNDCISKEERGELKINYQTVDNL